MANENKLDQMLPGDQILKSLELQAKVELIGGNIQVEGGFVNLEFSNSESERSTRHYMHRYILGG